VITTIVIVMTTKYLEKKINGEEKEQKRFKKMEARWERNMDVINKQSGSII
jgi:hypothetical protein